MCLSLIIADFVRFLRLRYSDNWGDPGGRSFSTFNDPFTFKLPYLVPDVKRDTTMRLCQWFNGFIYMYEHWFAFVFAYY